MNTHPVAIEKLEELLSQTATRRLRFELVINELLDKKLLTENQLVIYPERNTAYNFERDVQAVTQRTDEHHPSRWQVSIPRDGFYDSLPERLFHQARKRTKDEDEWADIRQQEDKQESESRHFLLPFDSAFNHQRAKIAHFETHALAGDDDFLLTELLRLVAPAVDGATLAPDQKITLFLIIVGAWQTVGNPDQTAECFSRFLGVPVRVQRGLSGAAVPTAPAPLSSGNWQPAGLGSGRLGADFVLPQPPNSGGTGLICLVVGPLTDAQLTRYLPGGTGLGQVQLLADYLLPADVDWQLDIIADDRAGGFWLDGAATAGRLGLTTALA